MSSSRLFALKIRDEDRQTLKALAAHLERSEADTIKFVVRAAARKAGIAPTQPQAPAESR